MKWEDLYTKWGGAPPKKGLPFLKYIKYIIIAVVVVVAIAALVFAFRGSLFPSECVPSCRERCGQEDGCGGVCPTTDSSKCGKCGNEECAEEYLLSVSKSGSG